MNKKLQRECKAEFKKYLAELRDSTDPCGIRRDAFEEGFKAAMKIFTQKIDDTLNKMEE